MASKDFKNWSLFQERAAAVKLRCRNPPAGNGGSFVWNCRRVFKGEFQGLYRGPWSKRV